ncbi:hypothetical protein [Allomuricauda sp. NBRC 101325]|uniref:hypothetical protein n=1 Tax=Allomuricauda sp. NBRC 101325 TaxID=1113758 RepID=UPI0024A08F5D|nr:hypothetical protein [Muricauda sp. NBRC 101325]GLU44599.1 hypothetical protein Musp01_22230 [Muricauda sp. NBRC 101325]
MNKIKVFLMILFIGIISCEEKNQVRTEKLIAEKLAKHVIEEHSLKGHTYSGEIFLHIKLEKLNDRNFKALISLNGLKSNSAEFRMDSINIDELRTIIYFDKSENENKLPEPFFVPDSESWSFLAELIGNEIVFNALELSYTKDKIDVEDLNEIEY